MSLISLDAIQAIADRIADQFHPDKIILFGSYAYGHPSEGSDVDLLVIMPFEGRWFPQVRKIKASIRDLRHFPVDIVVKPPDEVAWRYDGHDPLMRYALDYGKVLYEPA